MTSNGEYKSIPEVIQWGQPVDYNVVGELCALHIHITKVTKIKSIILTTLSFFIFSLFVMTDGLIEFIEAMYGGNGAQPEIDQAKLDVSLFSLFVVTIVWCVVSFLGLIIAFAYSVRYIWKQRQLKKDQHSVHRLGHLYIVSFFLGLFYYLLCCIRAILLVDCKRPTVLFCKGVFAYSGLINVSFVIVYAIIVGFIGIVIHKICKYQFTPSQKTSRAPYFTVNEVNFPNYVNEKTSKINTDIQQYGSYGGKKGNDNMGFIVAPQRISLSN